MRNLQSTQDLTILYCETNDLDLSTDHYSMDSMPKSVLLLGLLIVAAVTAVALYSADSDGWEYLGLLLLIGGPIVLLLALFAFFQLLDDLLGARAFKLRTCGLYFGAVLVVSAGLYGGVWRWFHSPGITYQFSYGQTGGWQEVQFTHVVQGHQIQGPWVGGWPLSVRFPDLNHDGFPDIRVLGDDRVAEFVYLPNNDGKCFWHLLKNDGFLVSYPPDGVIGPD